MKEEVKMKITLQTMLNNVQGGLTIVQYAQQIQQRLNFSAFALPNLTNQQIDGGVINIIRPFLQCYLYTDLPEVPPNTSTGLLYDFLYEHYTNVFVSAISLNLNHFLLYITRQMQLQQMINMITSQYTQTQKHTTAQQQKETETIDRTYTNTENVNQNTNSQHQNINVESYDVMANPANLNVPQLQKGANGAIPTSQVTMNGVMANWNQDTETNSQNQNTEITYKRTEDENKNVAKTNDIDFNIQQFDFTQLNSIQTELNNYIKPIINKIAKSFNYLYSTTTFEGVYWM